MIIVGLGSLAALFYGVANLLGGVAASRGSAVRVTVGSLIASALVVLPALLIVPAQWSGQAVGFGAVAGVLGTINVFALYRALSLGPIGFVAPVVALLSTLLPAAYSVVTGNHLSPLLAGALAVAIFAAALLSGEPSPEQRPRPQAIVLAVVAGLADGGYMIALAGTPAASGALPAVADLVVGVVLAAGAWLVVARRNGPGAPLVALEGWLIVGTGVVQGVGTVLQVFALHQHNLPVVAALVALSQVATVGLARLVLGSRISLGQAVGIALAAVSVGLLANALR